MARALDILSLLLFLFAVLAFVLGVLALGDRQDLQALYWLIVGGVSLKSATELLRPRSGSR